MTFLQQRPNIRGVVGFLAIVQNLLHLGQAALGDSQYLGKQRQLDSSSTYSSLNWRKTWGMRTRSGKKEATVLKTLRQTWIR